MSHEDDIVCSICDRGDEQQGNQILLCDGIGGAESCPLAFHQQCIQPAVKRVPAGKWFCPVCCDAESKGEWRGWRGLVRIAPTVTSALSRSTA